MFENVNGRTDEGRRTDAGPLVSYKLTGEPSAQVSLKQKRRSVASPRRLISKYLSTFLNMAF